MPEQRKAEEAPRQETARSFGTILGRLKRRDGATSVWISAHGKEEGWLTVRYGDGNFDHCKFGSYEILKKVFYGEDSWPRVNRNFRGANLFVDGILTGELPCKRPKKA